MSGHIAPGSATPVSDDEFAGLMRPFAPFETKPVLAVGVSGGRDSRALALLLHIWAARGQGRIVALIVDHGLRPEAAREAGQTQSWLATLGIESRLLQWRPAQPPRSAVQVAARAARYALMRAWCREYGVVHLLTAHQADDQIETHQLRMARDSGSAGLAGMSAQVEFPEARLLRPLLRVPRSRLTATLAARGHDWIDDPSNDDPRYARVRLRQVDTGPDRTGIAERIAFHSAARPAGERALASALAACATPHPLGSVHVEAEIWMKLPADIAQQALAAAVAMVAGSDYPPRRVQAEAATRRMRASPGPRSSSGFTLGGCQILWRDKGWMIVREPASVETRGVLMGRHWDGRFDIRGGHSMGLPAMDVAGAGKRREMALSWPAATALHQIAAGLPLIATGDGTSPRVPSVEGARADVDARPDGAVLAFRPRKPLASGPFFSCFAAVEGQIVNDNH